MIKAHKDLNYDSSEENSSTLKVKRYSLSLAVKEFWENELSDSPKRKAISEFHGTSISILDSNKNIIGTFSSNIKVSEFLGCNPKTSSKYLDSNKLYSSKKGLVYLISNEIRSQYRSLGIKVFDTNDNLLEICNSIRSTSKKYNIPYSTLLAYIDNKEIYRGLYRFEKVS